MKLSQATLLLSALAVPFGASADELLYLQTPVQVAPGSFVPQAVRNQCELERHLVDQVSTQISNKHGRVELAAASDDTGNDKVIKITITNAWGAGGGGWSGPKSLEVRAELTQAGSTLSTAWFRRSTMGLGGIFSGTCPMFHKVTKELGEDVADWLNDGAPSKTAPVEEPKPVE